MARMIPDINNMVWADNDRFGGGKEFTRRQWSSSSPSLAGGKVRQLFKERRAIQGWDRSKPLEPIKKQSRFASTYPKPLSSTNPHNLISNQSSDSNWKSNKPFQNGQHQEYFNSDFPENIFSDDGMDVRRSNIPCRVPKSVPERTSRTIKSPTSTDVKRASKNVSVHSSSDVRRTANSVLHTNTEIRRTPNSIAGLQTTTEVRRSPNAIASLQSSTEVRRTPNSVATMHSTSEVRKSSNSVSSLTNSISRLSTSSSTSSTTSTSKPSSLLSKSQPVKRIERKPDESRPKADSIQVKPAAPADPNLVTCNICSRHFDPERIGLHMTICKKTSTKKRRPFDPVKHRLQGTEAEEYLRKPRRSAAASAKQDNSSTKKANWRKKHEEFISIVRAAREAQAYVAKGGKLSDLPPPPSLNTDDLTPCPHCGRKFAEGAAERHIPKCANIRSNKAGGGNKARAVPGRR